MTRLCDGGESFTLTLRWGTASVEDHSIMHPGETRHHSFEIPIRTTVSFEIRKTEREGIVVTRINATNLRVWSGAAASGSFKSERTPVEFRLEWPTIQKAHHGRFWIGDRVEHEIHGCGKVTGRAPRQGDLMVHFNGQPQGAVKVVPEFALKRRRKLRK